MERSTAHFFRDEPNVLISGPLRGPGMTVSVSILERQSRSLLINTIDNLKYKSNTVTSCDLNLLMIYG
jgi:hypothetical protein